MSSEFARILQGLMENRHLAPRAVSRASGRAESTVNQLLNGSIQPSVEILHDLAPVLQMSVADLLVIAGVSGQPAPDRPRPYPAMTQIGQLVALASTMTAAQVEQIIHVARSIKE
jgi:transcriptional regulator with XRE-family HTH domain